MPDVGMLEYLIIGILVLISINDIKKLEVPDCLSFLLIVIGLFNGWYNGDFENKFLGMGTYIIPFILIYGYIANIFKKEILGFGDIKLVMGIGAIIGYKGLISIYVFFINSFILASFYCLYIVIVKKKRKEERTEILLPFAPFLALSGLIALFFS